LFRSLRNSELIKNAAILIGSNGFAQIITLLLYPLIARLFTPGEFGQLAVIVSLHSLLATAASARYEQAIVLPENDAQAADLFRLGWRIAVVFSLLIAPMVFLIQQLGFLASDAERNKWFFLLGLMVLPAAYQQLGSGWCIRFRMFPVIAGATLVMGLSNALLKVLTGLLQLKDGLLYAFLLAQLITALFLFIQIRRNRKLTPGTSVMLTTGLTYINFPRYNLLTALLNSFSGNLPVYLLALYFTDSLTGQFSIALALVFRPVSTYNGSVYQVLMQKVVALRHTGSASWPVIRKYLSRTLLFAAGPAMLMTVLIPYIIKIYIGDNWTDAGRFCQFLIPYAAFSLLCGPLAFIPNMFNRQFQALLVDIVYLILRAGALAAGIILKNAYLGIGLYALAGIIVFAYQLIWYRDLIMKSDRNRLIST
jgi:O-antigen/teichoic acid export membrane protein